MSLTFMRDTAVTLTFETPPVTVLVCTRDRGDSIASTIRSILACTYPSFILVVVDQSSDLQTEQMITVFCDDPRLRYIHTNARGLGIARNIGIALSQTDLVLITDDDCQVPPNWIAEMVAPFLHNPRVGIVFCDVIAAPHDHSAGFIPVSLSTHSLLIEDLARWRTCDGVNIGIGAGMAIRRSTAEAVGGFNPLFGSGSHFRSGDDLEFTLHTLAAGYQIYRTNTVGVTHYGFRTYAQGRQLVRKNVFGIGAIYGQLLRRGYWIALRYYTAVFNAVVIMPALKDLAHARPPRKLGRATWLLRGLIEGLCVRPTSRTRGFIGIPKTPITS